jgi:alkaline phosphatase D
MTIKTDLTRRSFMKTAAAGAGAVAVPMALTGCGADDDDSLSLSDSKLVVQFGHGVASGDPLSDRVIIWTRVTLTDDDASAKKKVPVEWKVATDAAMANVVSSGIVETNSDVDYTVKIDVDRLLANTTYYYEFTGPLGIKSTVGETKTLPVGYVESVKLAVCSCANYPAGFFNVYQAIARSDADVVIHLGDYIYEYQTGEYPVISVAGRAPDQLSELLTLDDYRGRYAQYRIDEKAQLVHKMKPFICVWDDHELANDSYKEGAQNHSEDGSEGDFAERRAAAFQAYHEWLPIRTGSNREKIYRNFKFGELLSLNMMDTRHIARDKPLTTNDLLAAGAGASALITDPSRRLIGDEQLSWLIREWSNSTTTWEVLGQQVLMGRIFVPVELLIYLGGLIAKLEAGLDASAEQTAVNTAIGELYALKLRLNAGDPSVTDAEKLRLSTTAPYNLDSWDGYFVEREQILNRAHLLGKNVVTLAGDTHNAWASNLRFVDDQTTGELSERSVGVELATSSVTSPGFDQYLSLGAAEKVGFESSIIALVDDLQYMDANRRGFLAVTFTPEVATAEWNFVGDITVNENIEDVVATNGNYVELAADGTTPVAKVAKFNIYPNSSGRLDANTLVPSS